MNDRTDHGQSELRAELHGVEVGRIPMGRSRLLVLELYDVTKRRTTDRIGVLGLFVEHCRGQTVVARHLVGTLRGHATGGLADALARAAVALERIDGGMSVEDAASAAGLRREAPCRDAADPSPPWRPGAAPAHFLAGPR